MTDGKRDNPTTVQAVSAIVAVIEESIKGGYDPEAMHAAEDSLYIAVLKSIAEGTADDPAAMAREALRVDAMEFTRWYA